MKKTTVLPGLCLISLAETAKLEAKLKRFSSILWLNSMKVETLAVSACRAGVCPSRNIT
jgi:hypothetical protein